MLEPIMNVLSSQRVILASSSPRRQEVLKRVGLQFEVIPSSYEENLNPEDFENAEDFVITTAKNKVFEVEQRINAEGGNFDLIIGADTVVYMKNKVFQKPKHEDEAITFLKAFSGNHHFVYTGVALKSKLKLVTFHEVTRVYFAHLSDEIIRAYVNTGEYMDKAGGYGMQEKAGSLIEKIEGDFFNVMGLPLHKLCKHIIDINGKSVG